MNLFLRSQKMRYEKVPGGVTGAMPEKLTFKWELHFRASIWLVNIRTCPANRSVGVHVTV